MIIFGNLLTKEMVKKHAVFTFNSSCELNIHTETCLYIIYKSTIYRGIKLTDFLLKKNESVWRV